MITDLRENGRQISHWRLRELMGIPGKLPKDDMGGKMIGDTQVHLLSAREAKALTPKSKRPHRMIAQCRYCPRAVPAGKLQQHIRVHRNNAQELAERDRQQRWADQYYS